MVFAKGKSHFKVPLGHMQICEKRNNKFILDFL